MPKNPHAKALSDLGAKKGGNARSRSLTPEERRDIARDAVQARWRKAGKLKNEDHQPDARAAFAAILDAELAAIREAGMLKEERILLGTHGSRSSRSGHTRWTRSSPRVSRARAMCTWKSS